MWGKKERNVLLNLQMFIFTGDFLPHRPETKRACNRHIPSRPLVRIVPAARIGDERGQRLPSLLPSGQAALPEACILQRRHTFHQVCGGLFILKDDAAEEEGTEVWMNGLLLLLKILLWGTKCARDHSFAASFKTFNSK